MGDGLKLSKEKRHRSSSSLGGAVVEGTRSERKLDLTDSIPEVEDQFALAEARCENLQEKIDLVKVIKRKKKLKKLSMTRVNEPSVPPENISFITVRTQPKKKAVQARLRRLEPTQPTRGYTDPAAAEQHRMLGQMREYNQPYDDQDFKNSSQSMQPNLSRTRVRRARADGDRIMYGRSVQRNGPNIRAAARNYDQDEFLDYDQFEQRPGDFFEQPKKKTTDVRQTAVKSATARRRHVPKESLDQSVIAGKWTEQQTREQPQWQASPERRRLPTYNNATSQQGRERPSESPVVELFNNPKTNASGSPVPTRQPAAQEKKAKKNIRESVRHGVQEPRDNFSDQSMGPLGDNSSQAAKKKRQWPLHKVKYGCRRYELPTMASQMKQSGMRYYRGVGNRPNIPFVVSKSTAPSHNIGVNIQQVLNGLKVQQPLTGIPPTIAHHMGLGHVSSYAAKNNIAPVLSEHRAINAIRLGRRLLRLPSNKYISYNRMLNLYREGEGMVPRFLRAISRPHYFYTSMYNLATTGEDLDGATSKGNGTAAQEAKQSLAEYATLYREYEQLDKAIREGNYEPEWERRRDEISKELAMREERVRKMVQDYKGSEADLAPLRASASTAEDGVRRRSSYKLGD